MTNFIKRHDAISAADPLLSVIKAYNQGWDELALSPPDALPKEAEDALWDEKIGKHSKVLRAWSSPALSQESALAALNVVQRDMEAFEGNPLSAAMFAAALAFIESSENAGELANSETASTDRLPSELEAVIAAFVDALAAWYAASVDGQLPDNGPEPDAFDATAEAFICFQCTTDAEVQRKLQFVASCQAMKEEIDTSGWFEDFCASLILPLPVATGVSPAHLRGDDAHVLDALIERCTVALAAFDATDDDERNADADFPANVEVDASRRALLDFQPSTLQGIRKKARAMLSLRNFAEWDDFERSDLIRAFVGEGA